MKNGAAKTTGRRLFETTSIHLASAILVHVPDSILVRVSNSPSIDGKRLMVLAYPAAAAQALQAVVEQFNTRRLVVPLYAYNRALNAVRDRLMPTAPADRHHASAGHAVSG
jgi:hypothetical protein